MGLLINFMQFLFVYSGTLCKNKSHARRFVAFWYALKYLAREGVLSPSPSFFSNSKALSIDMSLSLLWAWLVGGDCWEEQQLLVVGQLSL